MRFKLFTLLLTIITLIGHAQQEDSLKIRAIANEILLNGKAYENLRILTKQVGARLAGTESIHTKTLGEWKRQLPDLHKRPTIFCMLAS